MWVGNRYLGRVRAGRSRTLYWLFIESEKKKKKKKTKK